MFVRVNLKSPSDAKWLNLDNVSAVGEGDGGVAKLFMTSGEIYYTCCVLSDFLEICRSAGALPE